jgi:Na+/melibiose symporter-like transporter
LSLLSAEVQSASAQTAIVSLYTILPALLMALSIVAMYFYNLDKELPTVQKELAERSSSGQKGL